MKVFVAGATGAIGKRLVPLLAENGFEVIAMTRSAAKARMLFDLGAEPIVADGLDRAAVRKAVTNTEPEVVVHQMTSLAGVSSFKRLDEALAGTNRLRTAGTDYLLEAAKAAGVRRVIAQTYGVGSYADGAPVRTEADQPTASPPPSMRLTIAAIRHVESIVPAAEATEGVVLRYGAFYGPGTSIAVDGDLVELVQKRKFPIVGSGAGIWSFVHVDDAAAATLAAIKRGGPGIYNIADDEPAPVAAWLPELANAVGAKPPRHVPEWVARILAGEYAVYASTRIRGLANDKAKRELAWLPAYRSWRDGFRRGLAAAPTTFASAA